MGKFINKGTAFLFTLFMVLMLGSILYACGASPQEAGVAVGLLAVLSVLPTPSAPAGSLHNEVLKVLFSNDLQQRLFPNNAFYTGAQVDPGVEISQTSVEVPQDEDGDAQYIVNPSTFPLSVYSETDTKKTYSLDQIATKPQLITDLNEALVSYDKRAAKLTKHANTLNSVAADYINYAWTSNTAAYIRKTTGTDVRTATAPGATGDRKRVTKADILWAMSLFNDTDIPTDGRRLLIPAGMYEDLLTIDDFINSEKLRMRGDVPNGMIGEVLGFQVFMRSRTTKFNGSSGSPTKRAVTATNAATDSFSALFFHPRFVRYAKGTPKVYINEERGEYLGATMNAAVRSGGMISRISEKGVAVLVEAVA